MQHYDHAQAIPDDDDNGGDYGFDDTNEYEANEYDGHAQDYAGILAYARNGRA